MRTGNRRLAFGLGLTLGLTGWLGPGCAKKQEPTGSADSALQFPSPLVPRDEGQPEGPPPPLAPALGPFVEPPLFSRPARTFHVIADQLASLEKAAQLAATLAAVPQIPVGYPSLDGAENVGGVAGAFVVVAGKFVYKTYAQALSDLLLQRGFKRTVVISRPYRHDRFRPSPGEGSPVRLGRIFAGVPGGELPLLRKPSLDSEGEGTLVMDGAWVKVQGEQTVAGKAWYRIQSSDRVGFLPAGRLLVDPNVFPAPNGRLAVLGVNLGCEAGPCQWDYWLINSGFDVRRLLAPSAARLPHAFSPDGRFLVWTAADLTLVWTTLEPFQDKQLGPGISPSWSADGRFLYYRKPARGGLRDEVMVLEEGSRVERVLLDYPGIPIYPQKMALLPPPVDLMEKGQLFTVFCRQAKTPKGPGIKRWTVWFGADGKMIGKKGEFIAE